VFCPKLATLTVSIVTFQKSVLKYVPNDVPNDVPGAIPIDDAWVFFFWAPLNVKFKKKMMWMTFPKLT
jgi:hypothetical protein